jgi:transposase
MAVTVRHVIRSSSATVDPAVCAASQAQAIVRRTPEGETLETVRQLITTIDGEIATLDSSIRGQLADDAGFRALQQIPGVGPVLATVFVAEIGDITRFPSERHLCSWAGLTPSHRESDATVHRGHIGRDHGLLPRLDH